VLLEEDWDVHLGTGHLTGQLVVATNAMVHLAGYCASLRGQEIPKSDIVGTAEHRHASVNHRRHPHITLALKGRVKGETADRCHLLPLAMTTASGLRNGLWIQRLLDTLALKGITTGALICCQKGGRWVRGKIVDLDPMFHDYLRRVQVRWRDVMPAGEDPCKLSSIYRSLRRGSVARARNVKIPQAIIKSNARWRKVERGRGKQLSVGMMEHYSDVVAMVEMLLQYSRAI
jgi:hypothetical protein